MANRPSGFAAFTVMWLGQLLSALGTRMTNFALSIWVWQETGSATSLTMMMFFGLGSTVLFSPLAGSLVDRWDRRRTLALSDAGAAVVTAGLLVLFLTGSTQLWQLYLVNFLTGAFLAVQMPAYMSTITVMMDKAKYTRANAMMWTVRFLPAILAPGAAAVVLGFLGVHLVLLLDVVSCLLAVAAVYLVRLPDIERTTEPLNLWRDCVFGFRYITRRRPLLALQTVLFAISLLAAIGVSLLIPLIMARTGGDEGMVGIVLTIAAFGGVAGAVALGVYKPRGRKITVVLLAILGFSVLGRVVYGVGESMVLWAAGLLFVHLFIPFIDGLAQTIWQEKVEPAVQGRVFSARLFLENLAIPIGLVVAGPLADQVFEPAMAEGGSLAGTFGWLVGTGPGAGIGLLYVVIGVLGAAVAAAGFASRSIREVETLVPDHDTRRPEPSGELALAAD